MRFHPIRYALALVVCLCAAALQAQLTIYDDALAASFADYSYPSPPSQMVETTAQHHTGTKSISFTGAAAGYNALSFYHTPDSSLSTVSYASLHFWVRAADATSGQHLRVFVQNAGVLVGGTAVVDHYIVAPPLIEAVWKEVTVPITSGEINYNGAFDRIDIQSDQGSAQPAVYIDGLELLPPGAPPPPANLLVVDHGVTVSSMVSDRFTWHDSQGNPRVAVLARNDVAYDVHLLDPDVPGGNVWGGALRQYQYKLAGGATRTMGVTGYGNGGYGGFGYVVEHSNAGSCVGDDSPLGDWTQGSSYSTVFEGRHHAIYRFTQNYPRNCPGAARTIPVTIDWIFSTGHDHPVYAITFDVAGTGAPAGTLNDDSRAPYGELEIDGNGAENIDGVAWGDHYKFTTTTPAVPPVPPGMTLNSDWTYNVLNTVPYVKEWILGPLTGTNERDATMGLVQTQTLAQQDAGGARIATGGGFHDIRTSWGTTSAAGNAGNGYKMPWQDNWPYQLNNDSLGAATPNNNARLTWGTQYGFVGPTTYTTNNTLVTTAPGYPRKSYSLYVVAGQHTQ